MKVLTAIKPILASLILCYGAAGMAETICYGNGDPEVSRFANAKCDNTSTQDHCCAELCRIVYKKSGLAHDTAGFDEWQRRAANCANAARGLHDTFTVIGSGTSPNLQFVFCECK